MWLTPWIHFCNIFQEKYGCGATLISSLIKVGFYLVVHGHGSYGSTLPFNIYNTGLQKVYSSSSLRRIWSKLQKLIRRTGDVLQFEANESSLLVCLADQGSFILFDCDTLEQSGARAARGGKKKAEKGAGRDGQQDE